MRAYLILIAFISSNAFAIDRDIIYEFTDSKGSLSRHGVSFFRIPYFDIRSDDNDPGLVELRSNFLEGDGKGIRLSLANTREPSAMSLTYYQVDLFETESDTRAKAHALNLNLQPRRSIRLLDSSVEGYGGLLMGAGVSKFDFRGHSSNEWSLSGELGLDFGINLNETLLFGIGGALHVWGYPGETVGYGSYVFGEISVHF